MPATRRRRATPAPTGDFGGDGAAPALGELVEALRRLRARSGPVPAERKLAAVLGVKRHSLRRAIALLQQNGEWTQRPPRREARASGPAGAAAALHHLVQDTNPQEVMELRLALEPALVRFAALRASPAEVAGLRAFLAGAESAQADGGQAGGAQAGGAQDGGVGRAEDIAFHDRIAAATRNSLAVALLRLVGEIGRDSRVQLRLPTVTLQREAAEHRAILDAIAARDPDAAEQAMREHLNSAQRWMLRGTSSSAA